MADEIVKKRGRGRPKGTGGHAAGTVHLVEYTPVRYGKWLQTYRSSVTVSRGYVSSCCDMWNERKTMYCPYCGARMRGE